MKQTNEVLANQRLKIARLTREVGALRNIVNSIESEIPEYEYEEDGRDGWDYEG